MDKNYKVFGIGFITAFILAVAFFGGLLVASPLRINVNGREIVVTREWFKKHKKISSPRNRLHIKPINIKK